MKFKGIYLDDTPGSATEILIRVELTKLFENILEYPRYAMEMEDRILSLFTNFNANVYTERISNRLIEVRSNDITFDMTGIALLSHMYGVLVQAELKDVNLLISVFVDGNTWFVKEDGSKYNQDDVTFEEFLNHLEY